MLLCSLKKELEVVVAAAAAAAAADEDDEDVAVEDDACILCAGVDVYADVDITEDPEYG